LLESDGTFGRQEVERAVRPMLVVMPTVDAQHMLEMSATEDEHPIEAVGRTVRTQRSA